MYTGLHHRCSVTVLAGLEHVRDGCVMSIPKLLRNNAMFQNVCLAAVARRLLGLSSPFDMHVDVVSMGEG